MRYRALPLALMLSTSLACGSADDDETDVPEGKSYPELSAADPLDLQSVDLGAGVRHGEALGVAHFSSGSYTRAVEVVPHAVAWVQAYDEAASTFGEYQAYAIDELMPRTATAFIGSDANVRAARFQARAADIYEELDDAADTGGAGFQSRSIVLDLFRLRGDWWVRWDGNLEDVNLKGKGPYGLNRQDMYEDLLAQIEVVAEAQQPRYFIIGDEVERLLMDSEGPGLSEAEFSNFMSFYQEAVSRIHAKSPNTKVGAGINWDRFVGRVAPNYALDDDNSHTEVLDRAFEAVVLPFAEIGDIVALQSYRDVDDTEIEFPVNNLPVKEAYQFLRRLPELYMLEAPIVFYAIGSPVDSPVAYLRQRNYLEAFVDWTAGLEPELVAWRYLANLDGTDTSNQEISKRCLSFTEPARNFELPVTTCYDGLFTSVFSEKPAFEYLAGE